jgi:hypothetical protein
LQETTVSEPSRLFAMGLIASALLTAHVAGCNGGKFDLKAPWDSPAAQKPEPAQRPVPEPIHLLLPKAIRVHPFTGTRTFDQAGGIKGIDVRIEALDAFGDSTKAFGKFFFALHQYVADNPEPKGRQIANWEEDLLEPKKNLLHWDSITRTYEFKLQWYRPIPVGSKFILVASFASPFTERKFAERVFVSGQ